MIPPTWKIVCLGKIASLFGGNAFSSSARAKSGVKWLKIANVGVGRIVWDEVHYLPIEYVKSFMPFLIKANDTLVALTRPLIGGELKIARFQGKDGEALLNQRVAKVVFSDVDPHFLFHVLRSPRIAKELNARLLGTDPPNLSQAVFDQIEVPLPNCAEQTKIAEILTCWDKAIELVERLIEEYDNIYRAISRSLLSGTIRFTDKEAREHDTYKTVALSDIFERVTRKNSENCNLALTISGRDGLIRQEEYFNKRVASERLDGYYLLNNGEFAFNRSSMNGYPYGAIKRLDRYDRGVVSTLYLCFKLKDTLACSDYFALYFDSGLFNREIYSIAQEGARSHGLLNIGTEEFFNLRVPSPPLDAQLRIAKVIMAFAAHNKNLRVYRDRLLEQKRGLMQNLLTGKIRVKA
jgi:type I restriction enzyme S subunit